MPSYKAILSGYSWNSEPTLAPQRMPIFLTYSFPKKGEWGSWGFKPFKASDQKIARKAIKQWGDACGIRFLETKSGKADIEFGWEKTFFGSTVAWAEFPELSTPSEYEPGEVLERETLAGDVRINPSWRSELSQNKSYKTFVMLHEIGHALGLKHPFHKMPYNRQLLNKKLDHTKNTVMSYDNGNSDAYPTKLRRLDKQAIKELYGPASADGTHVSGWSWNKWTETLIQVGKMGSDRIHGTAVQDQIHGIDGSDRLYGHDGNDTLFGGAGNDTLSGGDGSDIFVFDTALDATSNVDKIAGFDSGDSIRLSSAVFPILPIGRLSSAHFSRTGTAKDENDWIVLNEQSGALFYDPDGSGPVEKIQFARIAKLWGTGPKYLEASDFYIV